MLSQRGRFRPMWLSLRGPRLPRCARRPESAICVLIALAAAVTIPAALTAANSIEASRAGDHAATAAADEVKPTDCASITLSALYKGTGTVTGGTTNDLVLGGSLAQTLDGGEGNDCILGGDGDDQLNGGAGTDICIGGPGQDTFGADCETTIQGDATF